MAKTELTALWVIIDDNLFRRTPVFSVNKKRSQTTECPGMHFKHLKSNSHGTIYNSFIMINLDYCMASCGQVNNQKLEMNHKRALRKLLVDYNSFYQELLEKAGTTTVLIQWLRLIV